MKRFLPIRYTTVCRSHVEREHQFPSRTAINCSCRHVREERTLGMSGKPRKTMFIVILSSSGAMLNQLTYPQQHGTSSPKAGLDCYRAMLC